MCEFQDRLPMRAACPVMERIFFCCRTSHSYKQNSDITLHVHTFLHFELSVQQMLHMLSPYHTISLRGSFAAKYNVVILQ